MFKGRFRDAVGCEMGYFSELDFHNDSGGIKKKVRALENEGSVLTELCFKFQRHSWNLQR